MSTLRIIICLLIGTIAVESTPQDAGTPLILTPYIQSGQIEEALQLSLVTNLTPNITSYSGFITVNEECNSNLFFWFFPTQNVFTLDPLTIWLGGEPGVSVLEGLFLQNGPYELTLEEELKLREYSWNLKSSVLYIEPVIGNGFSFADSAECSTTTSIQAGDDIMSALDQFLILFPEMKDVWMYLASETYGAKYSVHIGEQTRKYPNLRGMIAANALIDPIHQVNYSKVFYELGLVSAKVKQQMDEIEQEMYFALREGDHAKALKLRDEDLLNDTFAKNSGFSSFDNFLETTGRKKADFGAFVNKADVREAIHVGDAVWQDDKAVVVNRLKDDILKSVIDGFTDILFPFRCLLYWGQFDLMVPYGPSINFVEVS